MPHTMLKRARVVIVGLCAAGTLVSQLVPTSATRAQTLQHWDTKARARSQAANSAGTTALLEGKIDKGVMVLRDATKYDPTDPVPYTTLALALSMKERYAEALDALTTSYSIAKQPETVLTTGIVHYLSHDWDASLKSFDRVLEFNPKLYPIYGDMGMVYLRKSELMLAGKNFQRLTQAVPNSQFGYQGIATIKYLLGDFDGARRACEHADNISPYPPVTLLMAKLAYLDGDRSRGQKLAALYTAAARKKGKKAKGLNQRSMQQIGYPVQRDFGWDPYLADNFDSGIFLQARCVVLPKEESRRQSLAKQGKADAVIESIKKALSDAQDDFWLTRELGLVQLANGNYGDAAESFKTVLRSCINCDVDMLHVARALYLDGKAGQASPYVREFIKRHPRQKIAPFFMEVSRIDPDLQSPGKPSGGSGSAGGKTIVPGGELSPPVARPPDDGGF